MVAKALAQIDDEEDEATRAIAAPWDENSMLVYTGRTPSGDPTYINISYTDPFSLFKSPFVVSSNKGWGVESFVEGMAEALEPFYGTELGTAAMIKLYNNQNGEVFNPNADLPTKIKDIGFHMVKALEPGAVNTADKIYRAATGKKTSSGKELDLKTEIIAVVTGQRITTTDRKKAIFFRMRDFNDDKRAATTRFNRAWRSQDATEEELREAVQQLRADRKIAFEEYQNALKAVSRLGLTDQEIILEVAEGKDHTKAAKDAMALLKSRVGEIPQQNFKFSKGHIEEMRKIEGREAALKKIAPDLFDD